MKTSRQRVLDYVCSQRAVSAAEISRALQMTEANVRYHLGVLETEGLVIVVGKRPSRSRGRPAQVYRSAEQASGHNLERLAGALLNRLVGGVQEQDRITGLKRLAQDMLHGSGFNPGRTGDHAPGAAQLTLRLNQAVRWLNQYNYQARWEAHASAPRIIFGHCPYAAILEDHPELCQLDACLLEEMLGSPAAQSARLALDTRGMWHCVFRLRIGRFEQS